MFPSVPHCRHEDIINFGQSTMSGMTILVLISLSTISFAKESNKLHIFHLFSVSLTSSLTVSPLRIIICLYWIHLLKRLGQFFGLFHILDFFIVIVIFFYLLNMHLLFIWLCWVLAAAWGPSLFLLQHTDIQLQHANT